MPTVLRSGPYRIFFYSNEGREPPHVHVERDSSEAKFWLHEVTLAVNVGFPDREITTIIEILEQNRELLIGKWNEHFGN